eukprot:COSAG01_NODE_603_length_14905_cov_12.534648_9_plen_157_part_00
MRRWEGEEERPLRRPAADPPSWLATRLQESPGSWNMGTRKPPPQKTGPATKFANAEINRELCWLAVHDYVEHKRDEGMDLSTLQSMDYNEVMSEIFDGGTTLPAAPGGTDIDFGPRKSGRPAPAYQQMACMVKAWLSCPVVRQPATAVNAARLSLR